MIRRELTLVEKFRQSTRLFPESFLEPCAIDYDSRAFAPNHPPPLSSPQTLRHRRRVHHHGDRDNPGRALARRLALGRRLAGEL